MVGLANLGDATPVNRALEALAGSDALFSRLGGVDGDPAATALAALPPLGLSSGADIGSTLTQLPQSLAGGLALPGTDAIDASSLLGSTSLGGGLLSGGALPGASSLAGTIQSTVANITSGLGFSDASHGVTSVLGSVGDLLGGSNPAAALTGAVGSTGAALGHVGSGAAAAVADLAPILTEPVTDTLNNVVGDVHTALDGAGVDLGLTETAPGVVALSDAIGLGDLGGDNLLTSVASLPGALLQGDLTTPLESLGGQLTNVVGAATDLVPDVIADLSAALGGSGDSATLVEDVLGVLNGGDPVGGVGNIVGDVGDAVGGLLGGVTGGLGAIGGGGDPTDALNGVVGGVLSGVEAVGAEIGLPATLESVSNLGGTLGLGDIGGDNLLTDVVGLPSALGSGDPAAVLGGVADHVGAILPAVTGVVEGVVTDLQGAVGSLQDGNAGGTLLSNVTDILGGGDPVTGVSNAVGNAEVVTGDILEGAIGAVGAIGGIGENSPSDTLNDVIGNLHSGIELAAHEAGLNLTLHGVTNLGETVGLGKIGGENLLTDVVSLPGEMLGGGDPAGTIGDIVEHAAPILPAAGEIVTGLVTDLGSAAGGSLPLPTGTSGADSLVGTLTDALHAPTAALPDPVTPIAGGDLDLGGVGDLVGGLTDALSPGTPEHHGGLGLGLI